MNLIIRPRAGGKTYEIITRMKDYPGSICVCSTSQMAEQMQRQAEARFPLHDWTSRFITSYNAREKLAGFKGTLFVDNADYVLADLLGAYPQAISLTGFNI